jgi:hypothetical protein
MLNGGEGFTDIFEREAMTRADKLNTQSRYKDWLHNVKVKLLNLATKTGYIMSR